MLYYLTPAIQPRMLVTFDEELSPLSVNVRVGQVRKERGRGTEGEGGRERKRKRKREREREKGRFVCLSQFHSATWYLAVSG